MKTKKMVIALLVVFAVMLANLSSASAAPPNPYLVWGTIKYNGANPPAGTEVSAWINGVKYAYCTVIFNSGTAYYNLSVPGEDPSVAGIQGGVPGDTVVFKAYHSNPNGPHTADQTGIWESSTGSTNINLTISAPTAVTIEKFTAAASTPMISVAAFSAIFLLGLCGLWFFRRHK